jgi:hypothetical protein
VSAVPTEAFDAVADVHGMALRSPECFATWALRKRNGRPARWAYRFTATASGTAVTEYWIDKRTRRLPHVGADFPRAASKEGIRKEINHDGMRQSLRRLKCELESGHVS